MYVLLPECPTAPERNVVFLTDGGARSSVLLCARPDVGPDSETQQNTIKHIKPDELHYIWRTAGFYFQLTTQALSDKPSVTNHQVGAPNPHTYHYYLILYYSFI